MIFSSLVLLLLFFLFFKEYLLIRHWASYAVFVFVLNLSPMLSICVSSSTFWRFPQLYLAFLSFRASDLLS